MITRNNIRIIFCLALTLIFFSGLNAGAASIKDRMVARIPTINSLKAKGLIGENNQGFLEFRSNQKPEEQIIQDENNDRRKVYGAIAQKQGVKPALVGQRRAKQIAEKGSSGYWFQNSEGKWYRKK